MVSSMSVNISSLINAVIEFAILFHFLCKVISVMMCVNM